MSAEPSAGADLTHSIRAVDSSESILARHHNRGLESEAGVVRDGLRALGVVSLNESAARAPSGDDESLSDGERAVKKRMSARSLR